MTRTHGHGALTEGDRERIFDLAATGVKSPTIAKQISRHPATVHWFMYTNGLSAPRELPPGRAATYQRAGVTIYRFTAEEDAFIEALRVQDFDFHAIAEASSKRFSIRRSAHSVQCRMIMLAAREGVA